MLFPIKYLCYIVHVDTAQDPKESNQQTHSYYEVNLILLEHWNKEIAVRGTLNNIEILKEHFIEI